MRASRRAAASLRLQQSRWHIKRQRWSPQQWRHLTTLAIETSCDDTSVAILEKHNTLKESNGGAAVSIHFHDKVTADCSAYRGVAPLVALESHQNNLAALIASALAHHRNVADSPVDFVTVTRGPGMRSNLSTGLDTAKGLSVAWQVPLLAVNHMQAHALTPRLVNAMRSPPGQDYAPAFPFLSLLVSGGHTMLIHSKSLCDHPTQVETCDTAIGDALDKIARDVVPDELLAASKSTMYGPILERFAFPDEVHFDVCEYRAPMTRGQEMEKRVSKWGWSILPPLALSGPDRAQYAFAGTTSAVRRIAEERSAIPGAFTSEERQALAREAMRLCFEHLGLKIIMVLKRMEEEDAQSLKAIRHLVVSGGVAANKYLKHVLLDCRGYPHIKLVFPPLELCTDNAAMIGWTGLEMYDAGWRSDLGCRALRKWPLDPAREGGILGVSGWLTAK